MTQGTVLPYGGGRRGRITVEISDAAPDILRLYLHNIPNAEVRAFPLAGAIAHPQPRSRITFNRECFMTRLQSNCLLLIAAMIWGAGNASQKLLLDDIGPFTAMAFRSLIAIAVLLPFAVGDQPKSAKSPERRRLTIATVTCFGIAVTLYQLSFLSTSVTNSGFLVNTCSVMTPLAAWWILRAGPALTVWPAAFAALTGITFLSGSVSIGANWGDFMCLLSALFYAVWMVLLGEYVRMHGAVRRLTVLQFAGTAAVTLILAVLIEPISLEALWRAAPHLVFVGGVSTGLGYVLQAIAQQKTSASEAAIIVSSESVFGAIGGYLVLSERLDWWGYAGAMLIMSAVLLVEVAPRLQQWFFRNFTVRTGVHVAGE